MLTTTADGRMATVAHSAEKNLLTQTGLLMEGDTASVRFLFAGTGHFECYGDLSITMPFSGEFQRVFRRCPNFFYFRIGDSNATVCPVHSSMQ
jgi:hypothetical protein